MTPNYVRLVLHEVLANGVSLNATAYLVVILGWVVAGAVGAFAGAFWGKRGEIAAVKRDLETIKSSVRETTAATEEIKARISGDVWLKQKRWDAKWGCYSEIVENLGEVHTLISEAIALQNREQRDGQDAAFDKEANEHLSRIYAAFEKTRRFGSKALLAVAPEVRTLLTRFGDNWNNAKGLVSSGTVARDAWIEISDVAREDLFGEPRETVSKEEREQ